MRNERDVVVVGQEVKGSKVWTCHESGRDYYRSSDTCWRWVDDHKITPGSRMNPHGQRYRQVTQKSLRQQILDAAPEILEAAIRKAKDGDALMTKLVIERVLPALKSVEHSGLIESQHTQLVINIGGDTSGADNAPQTAVQGGTETPEVLERVDSGSD